MTWLINLCAILVSAEGAPGRNVDYNACLAVAGEALRDKGIEVFPLWRTLASPQNRFNNFVVGSLVVSGEPVTYEGETGWDKIASSVLESVGLAHRPGDTCWADEPLGGVGAVALNKALNDPGKSMLLQQFRTWCDAQIELALLEQKTTHTRTPSTLSRRL